MKSETMVVKLLISLMNTRNLANNLHPSKMKVAFTESIFISTTAVFSFSFA
jgi:hypothetical protein